MMLSLSHSQIGEWNIIHIVGELDMATGPQLRQEIVRQVTGGNTHIVVDLENVDFIDSTGLGILVGGLKRTKSVGGDLCCTGLSDNLKEVFKLTGLDTVLVNVDLSEDPNTWKQTK